MTPDTVLALVVAFAILLGIGIALVRKHRQRRVFSTSSRRDQMLFERRMRIARQQRQQQRRIH